MDFLRDRAPEREGGKVPCRNFEGSEQKAELCPFPIIQYTNQHFRVFKKNYMYVYIYIYIIIYDF